MARKPIIFNPQLQDPQGINNYPGSVFRCFTVGDTLPFEFTLGNKDGSDLDVTGWEIKIAFAPEFNSASGLEVTIPLMDIDTRVFKGEITSDQTISCTPGLNKAVAKFITAGGDEYIIDMCILEIYQNLEFTLIP